MKSYQKLWKYANKIIPGGNGLLSKRPQRFSPNHWPTYYTKAKGIYLWDINGKKFTDMSIMGIGTSILGYANNELDNFIKKNISYGVNTTLNSLEEVSLAKELLKIDSFADQVKFARSGGEAVAIAIRIARAKNKKTKIAFSGYHGWQDWYLAANIKDKKNLNNHLLKNLDPIGVPKELIGSNIPIKFNDIGHLIKTIKKSDFAAIIVEPGRFNYMEKNFAKKINYICKTKNICLIVDEITCGWRSNLGGLYKKIGLKPDIVIYGKALGNGYAISSIVGKKKYLKFANKSFISSTAWTERVGFCAALKTIQLLRKKNYQKIEKLSKIIKDDWKHYSKKHGVDITVNNYSSIPSFQFNYGNKNDQLYTIFTNLFLKKSILATNSVYLCFAHNNKNIKKYRSHLDNTFCALKEFILSNKSLNKNIIRKSNY